MNGWLQQLEKADQERYELQKKIKALESGSALAAQKVCFDFSHSIEPNLSRFEILSLPSCV